MPDTSIRQLLSELRKACPDAITPYGGDFERAEDEHGLGWRLEGAPVTFSAITLGGTMPAETYDVQIESYPPGEYLFTGRYPLAELLQLVRRYFGPEGEWPTTGWGSRYGPLTYSRSHDRILLNRLSSGGTQLPFDTGAC